MFQGSRQHHLRKTYKIYKKNFAPSLHFLIYGIKSGSFEEVACHKGFAAFLAGADAGLVAEGADFFGEHVDDVGARVHVGALFDVVLEFGDDDEDFFGNVVGSG